MAAINMTLFTGASGFVDVGNIVQSVTFNLFWAVIIICIFIIMAVKLAPKYDIPSSFAVTSFVCFCLSLLLLPLGWINIFFPIGFAFILAVSLIIIRANA